MRITFQEDDFEPDAMDEYKRRVEQGDLDDDRAAMMRTFFTPHCPECMSKLRASHQPSLFYCDSCQRRLLLSQALYLRPLAPCPAPPYTREEIEGLL